MKLKGKITVSHNQSNAEESLPIRIYLKDERASCRVVEISIGLSDFAEALTGRAFVDCEFEWHENSPIGKVSQNKTERVPVDAKEFSAHSSLGPKSREAYEQKTLAPFEVDGWKAHKGDLFNYHNRHSEKAKGASVDVVFFRHVEAPEEEISCQK